MENYDIKFIFNTVNDWLRFAESKNGMLIAFDSAALWAILSFLKEVDFQIRRFLSPHGLANLKPTTKCGLHRRKRRN